MLMTGLLLLCLGSGDWFGELLELIVVAGGRQKGLRCEAFLHAVERL